MKPLLSRSLALVCLISLGTLLASAQSGSATPRPTARQREAAWLRRNRQAPAGQSAARLLFQALQQRNRMQVAQPSRSLRGPRAHAASSANPGAWQPLGPMPLNALPGTQYTASYGMLSGRITALAADLVTDPTGNTLYVGTAGGGLWESTNALSATPAFTPLTDSLPTLTVGAIAVDASTQPATIYIGTGDPNTQGDSYYGMGIFKSTDGGKTWTQAAWADNGAETFFGLSFSRILIDPANPQHLLAAATGSPQNVTAPFAEVGIYSSSDGGQTWNLAAQFNDAAGSPQDVTDLVYDSTNKIWYAAARGLGVYSSTDGKQWTPTSSPIHSNVGLDIYLFDRASLAVRNGTLYLLYTGEDGNLDTFYPPDTGLAESTDEGKTWNPLRPPTQPYGYSPEQFVFNGQGNYEQTLVAPPNSTALLIGGYRLWMTPDVTAFTPFWSDLGNTSPAVYSGQHAVAVVNSTTIFDGTEGGLWSTSDSGSTWTNDNATLADHLLLDATPLSAPGAYVAADGILGTAVANNDGTQAWSQADSAFATLTAADPDNPQVVYARNSASTLLVSQDGGKTFPSSLPYPDGFISQPGEVNPPMEEMPAEPANLILGSCRVWVGPAASSPYGASLTAVSPDLSQDAPDPKCLKYKGFVSGIASAPSDANVLYAVTTNRRVMGTTNLFAATPTWTNLTAAPLPDTADHFFSAIAVSPTDSKTVYVGVSGFGVPHLFKSTDGGASWMDITGNLPDAPVNAIAIDPNSPSDIYVATDVGVFVASDGGVSGETWQVMGSGLPAAPVLSLKFSSGAAPQLVAATHGRGAWAIAPLNTQPNFLLRISPDNLSVAGTSPLQITASITAVNGYSGTVTLSCTAPTTGCTLAQTSLQPGQSTTVSVDPSALPQGGPVTISATDGTLTHTQTADAQIPQLTVSPSSVDLTPGAQISVTGHDLDGNATIACTNLPPGVSCGTGGAQIGVNSPTAYLGVEGGLNDVAGNYTIQVTATTSTQTVSVPLAVHVEGFWLGANPANLLAATPSSSVTTTISVASLNPINTPVALSCDPSSGVQCSFSPTSITPGNNSTVTITNLGTLSQPLPVTVVGTAGSETESTQLTITLQPLALSAYQPIAIARPGSNTANFAVQMTGVPVGAFPTFTCTGATGISCVAGSAGGDYVFIAINGVSSVPAGTVNLPLTLHATYGTQQASLDFGLQFGDFQLVPDSYVKQSLVGADSASFTITPQAINGTTFTASIPLTCSVPSGLACSLTPASVTPGHSAVLNITGLGSLKPQQLTLSVSGSPNPSVNTTKLYLNVADFQLSSPTTTQTLATGATSAKFVILDTASMVGPVQLSCPASASVSCSFSPANLVGGTSSTLTVTGINPGAISSGVLSLPVTGTAGSLTHTLPLTIDVPDIVPATTTNFSPTQTVNPGETAMYSLTYTPVNGFKGNVAMSCSGAPAQATCSVSPSSFTLSGSTAETVLVAVKTSGSAGASALPLPGTENPGPGGRTLPWLAALFALAALLAAAWLPRRRRLAFGAALVFGALLLAGCGGSSIAGTNLTPLVPTPGGTSTITVTATSNGVSQTTKLTLNVQ